MAFPSFLASFLRIRRDRGGAALMGWALAGAAVAGLVALSVSMAERESRGHTVAQAAW